MFLPKKHADLPIEPSVLESLRAQEKSLKREKRKAAKERRQHAMQLKKAEKHAKKRIAARKAPQKASDCLQYLSMSQDGICEVEPGLFSMTMAFTDVNFQIAMLEEQKNIFTNYSEFLNYFDPSLHLEINLVTRSMDEEQFRRDTFLPLRGNDRDRYAEEMNQVVAEKALRGQNGLIREKYVTFSLHAENYQQAKEQLENRAADIADHFKRMGSSTRILFGIERLSLLQGIMRPNEEMSFSYDWLLAEDDLTTKDFISPSSYNWHPEHDDSRAVYRDRYQFGDKIGKTMYLRGIAPEMKNGLFSMLSELPFDHVITMHVDAMDQAEAVQEIEKKLAYMHKEEYDAIAKARERNMPASIAVSYNLKSKMHHTEQMMDDITTKNQKIFKVCILIHTYGDSNAQLDERVRRICSTVQQQTCRFDSILYEQRNAMNSMLPLGKKWLGLERTLETVSTAIYVPFTTQELFQPGGLYEGINARSKNLILCNRKLLPAPAGMVLGMTGYGKSFSVMQMVTNIMLRWPDDDIVLIDPEQEYTHLVTAMGGVVIDISASSPSHINPMDITEDYGDDEDPIRLKSQFLQNFCQLILHSSELSPQERTFIDVAAGLTYQRYMANPKREEMPTLHDFYRNLALQGEEVKPLLTALKLYVSGSMDLFAHQTNVNVQNHCICFNTVKLGNAYAGNAVTARFTKTVTLPPGAAGFKGWYENGADTYGNVEWASLLYRMDWEALYGVADGIKCRSVGSALTADELQALLAGLNIDPDTARGQVVAFAISCQGHFVYGQPSSLRGGPGNASVGMNLDCSSFVQYCYWAQGLPFAAGNTASYGRTSDLQAISSAEVQPGDLRVVYAAGGEQGHVQMALGGGAWIECCYCYGVCVNMSNAWMESRGCHYFTYAGF